MSWVSSQFVEHPILCTVIVLFFLFVMDGIVGMIAVKRAYRR